MANAAVQTWLRSVLGPYIQRDLVFSHVIELLTSYSSLSPRTASYTHDDGRTQMLLCIFGTLPISFKGKSYNIPIAFWIPYDYPKSPPMLYVTPTATMLVRPSLNVDVSGRCLGDYLQSWQRKSEGRSLIDLAQFEQGLFAREPPVYAKPPSLTSPTTSSPSPNVNGIQQAPRPAPKPPNINGTNAPQLPSRPGSNPQSPSPSSTERPPLPPPPVSGGSPARLNQSLLPKPNQVNYAPGPSPANNFPVHQQLMPTRQQSSPLPALPSQQIIPQRPNSHTAGSSNNQAMSLHNAQPRNANLPLQYHQHQIHGIQSSLPARSAQNIIDADEPLESVPQGSTSGPKRPANPQLVSLRAAVYSKMLQALQMAEAQHHAECAQLQALHNDLAKGEPAILDEMSRLETVKNLCLHVGSRYQTVVDDVQRNVQLLQSKDLGQIDDVLCSTTVVYNQLIDLVAEDCAIEDTIYQLGRGLNNDTARIDLDKFLKRVRSLAREQFLKRALINKILLSIALGAHSDSQ